MTSSIDGLREPVGRYRLALFDAEALGLRAKMRSGMGFGLRRLSNAADRLMVTGPTVDAAGYQPGTRLALLNEPPQGRQARLAAYFKGASLAVGMPMVARQELRGQGANFLEVAQAMSANPSSRSNLIEFQAAVRSAEDVAVGDLTTLAEKMYQRLHQVPLHRARETADLFGRTERVALMLAGVRAPANLAGDGLLFVERQLRPADPVTPSRWGRLPPTLTRAEALRTQIENDIISLSF